VTKQNTRHNIIQYTITNHASAVGEGSVQSPTRKDGDDENTGKMMSV